MAILRLVRDGTRLAIEAPPELFHLVCARLTFHEKRFLRGYEATQAKRANQPLVEATEVEAFAVNEAGKICAPAGFTTMLTRWAEKLGHRVVYEQLWKPDPKAWEVNLDRVKELYPTLDEDQWECVNTIFGDTDGMGGRVQCPTGWGKGTVIGAIAAGLHRARLHVIIKGITVMRQRLLPELQQNMFNVGVIGGGSDVNPTARILLISADSLHRVAKLPKADLALVDEAQKISGDSFCEKMGQYYRTVVWGLSATFGKRIDGKNYRQEMVCGPVRYELSQQESDASGRTTPVVVLWVRVRSDVDPMDAYDRDDAKVRHGVWRNKFRNDEVAKTLREFEGDNQVLVAADTLEHALYFRKAINDLDPSKPYTLVCAPASFRDMSQADRRFYARNGLIGEDEQMTDELKTKLTNDFTSGELRRVIATTVFNYGVSFNQLAIANRLTTSASVDGAQQFRGRLTRKADDKDYALLVDTWDVWNAKVKAAARARWRAYKELGSRQIIWDPREDDFVEFVPS